MYGFLNVSLESGLNNSCLCNHCYTDSNDIALVWEAQKDYKRWKVLNKSVLFLLSYTIILLELEETLPRQA